MKFSVELNCAPNQNTRFSSSLQCVYVELFPRLLLLVPSLSLRVNKGRMRKKIRCRRSKYIFMNRFLFAAWDIGFAFGAASLVARGCEYGDEIEL